MKINFSMVWMLFRTEMRMIGRNSSAIFVGMLLPLILLPVVICAPQWSAKRHKAQIESAPFRYVICGVSSNEVEALMTATLERMAKGTNRITASRTNISGDLHAALAAGDLELIIEGADPKSEPAPALSFKGAHPEPPAPLLIRLEYRADHEASGRAMGLVQSGLIKTRQERRSQRLEAAGFPVQILDVGKSESINVARPELAAGLTLGRGLTVFVLFFVFMGGSMIANDLLAGEKDRGTLETLLTSAAGRTEIILAKHLAICAMALAATTLQTAELLLMARFKAVPLPDGIAHALSPGTVGLAAALFLPMLALVAGILLLTSGLARTHREAQNYLTPILILTLLPAAAPFFPSLSLHSVAALVPVTGVALAVKEIFSGNFDWPMIALAWLATAASAVWVLRLNTRLLRAERLTSARKRRPQRWSGKPGGTALADNERRQAGHHQ